MKKILGGFVARRQSGGRVNLQAYCKMTAPLEGAGSARMIPGPMLFKTESGMDVNQINGNTWIIVTTGEILQT